MLADADDQEHEVLGAFRYSKNRALLHKDERLMPQRKSVWSSWNYLRRRKGRGPQAAVRDLLDEPVAETANARQQFVSLNSPVEPRPELLLRELQYDHPVFDAAALAAQRCVWPLQGRRRTWFCGAWMGAGFHEDGLQSWFGRGGGAWRCSPPCGPSRMNPARLRWSAARSCGRGADALSVAHNFPFRDLRGLSDAPARQAAPSPA